jgi:osomolarity two-component system sensor histidine kinase SLN1
VPADMHPPPEETPRPPLSGREQPPPPIQLPTTSPASIMAGIRHSSDPPLAPPTNRASTAPVTLASVPEARETPASAAAAGASAPWAGMPVLVVDDDSLTRMLMKRMLTRLGCRVFTAENGELALEMITASPRSTPATEDAPPTPSARGSVSDEAIGPQWSEECRFGVVFLDNQMPVLSGLEAVQQLRHAGRRDFVVGVTGNALLSDQEEYLEAGAD